jgi:hypothetical protein
VELVVLVLERNAVNFGICECLRSAVLSEAHSLLVWSQVNGGL